MQAISNMQRRDFVRLKITKLLITRREKEVLTLIAESMTNSEIAEKLFISVTTVDTHRKNILAKFDCRNIASLIKAAMQMQMI